MSTTNSVNRNHLHYSDGVHELVRGALLRGASPFRFSLQIPPVPSRYYEVGKLLAIPMVATQGEREWHRNYVADFTNITAWTEPTLPLDTRHLQLIADRIVRTTHIGVTGLPES